MDGRRKELTDRGRSGPGDEVVDGGKMEWTGDKSLIATTKRLVLIRQTSMIAMNRFEQIDNKISLKSADNSHNSSVVKY